MHNINPNKAGFAFATLLGGFHFIWSILVLFGVAQSLLDFIFQLHMLKPLMIVTGFSVTLALGLVLVTATLGYFVGYFFALIWNRLHS